MILIRQRYTPAPVMPLGRDSSRLGFSRRRSKSVGLPSMDRVPEANASAQRTLGDFLRLLTDRHDIKEAPVVLLFLQGLAYSELADERLYRAPSPLAQVVQHFVVKQLPLGGTHSVPFAERWNDAATKPDREYDLWDTTDDDFWETSSAPGAEAAFDPRRQARSLLQRSRSLSNTSRSSESERVSRRIFPKPATALPSDRILPRGATSGVVVRRRPRAAAGVAVRTRPRATPVREWPHGTAGFYVMSRPQDRRRRNRLQATARVHNIPYMGVEGLDEVLGLVRGHFLTPAQFEREQLLQQFGTDGTPAPSI